MRPDPSRARVRRGGTSLAGVAVAGCALLLVGATPPVAQAGTPVTLVAESFSGSTTASPDWATPALPVFGNSVCLTAGTNPAATPIPGCALPTPDAPGDGVLQLTGNAPTHAGGVAYSLSQPAVYGIDVSFDSYQYGGSGADGIAFFLAAADPSDPQPPATLGIPGGDLGYSATVTPANGLSDGYLGIGLDVYGNYTVPAFEGSGCSDPGWAGYYPDNVSVRGPGNGTVGYCMLASTAPGGGITGSLDGGSAGTRTGSRVPVEVVVNPTGSAVTTASGLDVPNGDYEVAFTPIGAGRQTLTGVLPTTGNGLIPDGTIPASWIDPSTGMPYQITFGWVGSSGSLSDDHEIGNVTSTTLSGEPPQLTASITDSAAGAPRYGADMDYDVAVSNSAGAGDEADGVTLTDTLPSGETPQSAGLGGTGWTCSISPPTVQCTNPGPVAAGGSLPALTIPVQVTAPVGSVLTDSATASSDDASPASGEDTVTVALDRTSFSSAASPPAVSSGNGVALSASGLPADATGTVGFASAGSPLCSSSVSSGAASCSTGALAAGSYPVIATYSGDSTFDGSTARADFAVTPDPVLGLSLSSIPDSATAGSTYSLSLGGSLVASGGPAYTAPTLTLTLSAGETFAVIPSGSGWNCAPVVGGTALSCDSTATTPIPAGTSLGSISGAIDIAETASGSVSVTAGLADAADLAIAAGAVASIQVTAAPAASVPPTGSQPSSPWWPPAALLIVAGTVLIIWGRRRSGARPRPASRG